MIRQLEIQVDARCLGQPLGIDAGGQASCRVVEALTTPDGSCACGPGRMPLSAEDPVAKAIALDPLYPVAGWNCFCEIDQASGSDLSVCQNDPSDPPETPANGWCVIDAEVDPPVGNPAIVSWCPLDHRRIVRFVGDGAPQPGATLFITCE
jgi:hypothetical protein